MMKVDCKELTADEKLALAAAISDRLEGIALALIQDDRIVIDKLSDKNVERGLVQAIVMGFISRRKKAADYSTETDGDLITVHSADPVAAMRHKEQNLLPPNLRQCPFCAFVTPYDEEYVVHVRAHYFGVVA